MAIQWDKTAIIVTSVVGSLGVLSAIFGFSAEGTKLTPYTILVLDDECIYPSNPALALAVCGIVFLLLAQVTISAVGGCCGCCKSRAIPSETKRIVGIVCAVVSWIAAVVACVLLGEGASWNANVVRIGPAPFCPYLKDGILASGGVLTLVATALGITSFLLMRTQPGVSTAAAPGGIALGHPQFPPAASAGAKPPTHEQQQPAAMGQLPPLYPPKPQVYPAAEASPPTASQAQGYVHAAPALQIQQFSPHHPAFQGYGPHAPNQQPYPPPPQQQQYPPPYSPPQQQFSPPPPPQVYAQPPSYSPQYAAQPQVDVQVPAPPAPPQQQGGEEGGDGSGQSGMDLFKAGAKLFMRVAEHTLSSDNNNNNDDDDEAATSDSTTQDA